LSPGEHLELSPWNHPIFIAATYPERVRSLVLANLRASFPELRGFWHLADLRSTCTREPWYITADRRSDARGRVGTMTVKEVLVSAMNWEGSR